MIEEKWVRLKNFRGEYAISKEGVVKNLATGLIKKAHINKHGYCQINMPRINGCVSS